MKLYPPPKRYLLVFGTFLLSVLLYVDRVCIQTAKDPILDALNITANEGNLETTVDFSASEEELKKRREKTWGWIGMAFALGYALLQVPGGLLADRFGPRMLLTAVIVLWSLFTGLTAMAWCLLAMLVIRFLFGACEAGAFPGIARAVFSWFPMKERGAVNGINFSGSRLGAAAALPLVAWMVSNLGWRESFWTLAIVGFGGAVVWFLWFCNDPAEKKNIQPAELEYILAHRQKVEPQQEAQKLKTYTMLSSKNMWLIMAQYFASNFTFFFCLHWALPYFKDTYKLQIVAAGLILSLPFLGGASGNWISGWLVDRIYRQGKWKQSRMVPAIIGFSMATVGISTFVFMKNPYVAIVCLTLAIFGADMTLSPSWSTCVDIGKKHAGAISGTMNMAGNIGSVVTVLAFPYLTAWTGSAKPYFILAGCLNIVAISAWLLIKPDHSLEDY